VVEIDDFARFETAEALTLGGPDYAWTVRTKNGWLVTFVIGDDWRVAARIAVALLATLGTGRGRRARLVADAAGGALRHRA
jgi:hypothetical protein